MSLIDGQMLDLSKMNTYGTVNSIFVEIQRPFTNIKMPLVRGTYEQLRQVQASLPAHKVEIKTLYASLPAR